MSGRPAAVLLLGVLHLIQDSEDPRGIVGAADFRGDAAVTHLAALHRGERRAGPAARQGRTPCCPGRR
jgi:hypothetical protein